MVSPLPLYAQLKEELIDAIERERFGPGDQLPSQRALCEQYAMSHMTVRRAINELLHEGVIYAIPGKGIFAAEPKQEAEAGPLIGFSEDMAQRGMVASSKVLAADIASASTVLAQTLDVIVGTPLVHLRRLRLADDEPIAVQSAYLPHSLCPDLLEQDLERGSLYDVLRNVYGLHLADSRQSVEAALTDEEHARLLELTPPAALLISEQLTYLDTKQAIEFTRSIYRGDRYRMRLKRLSTWS